MPRITKTKKIVVEDGTVINVKKLPTDWKGIAAIIGAVLAVLGFFWNKIDGYLDQKKNTKVQESAYVELAGKVDTLYIKTAALEKVVNLLPSLLSRKPEKIERAVKSVKTVLKKAEKPKPDPEEVVGLSKSSDISPLSGIGKSPEAVLPAPAPNAQRQFPAAKLPSFQMVQRKAAE